MRTNDIKYHHIFWLEDSPNFFDRMEEVARQEQLSLDIPGLVRRTTFAFDLEMAVEIVSRESFDLYILDADFPNRATDVRRERLNKYLEKVRSGSVNHLNDYPKSGDHENNVDNNGFIFYEQQRSHIPDYAKVLVHSMSGAAPVLAYIFELPIYAKNETPEEIARQLQRNYSEWRFEKVPSAWERFVQKNGGNVQNIPISPQPNLASYEYGGRKELIE